MANKSITEVIQTKSSVAPILKTSDANGTAVDTKGFNSVEVVFYIGARGDTWDGSNHVQLEIEDSDDNSTFADLADAQLTSYEAGCTNTGTVKKLDAAGDGGQFYRTGVITAERYVRPVLNFTGTHSTGTVMAAFVILGNPDRPPTTNP